MDTTIQWSAIVAFAIFTLSQIINFISVYSRRIDEKKSVSKSLAAEVAVLLAMGGEAISPDGFKNFIKSSSVTEINSYSFVALQPLVYKNILKDLSRLDPEVIALAVKFYCLVDRMNAFITHFKSAEFLGASPRIHDAMKNILIYTNKEMHEAGRKLIDNLK